MHRTFLISYSHPGGFGRFMNYRNSCDEPSEDDIIEMEAKVAAQNGFSSVVVIAISEIKSTEQTPSL